jgi:hypothetical protein
MSEGISILSIRKMNELTPTELREWKKEQESQRKSDREKEIKLCEIEMKEIFDQLCPSANTILQDVLHRLQHDKKYTAFKSVPIRDKRFGKYFSRWLSDQLEDAIQEKVEIEYVQHTNHIEFTIRSWETASCDSKFATVFFLLFWELVLLYMVGWFGFEQGKRYR